MNHSDDDMSLLLPMDNPYTPPPRRTDTELLTILRNEVNKRTHTYNLLYEVEVIHQVHGLIYYEEKMRLLRLVDEFTTLLQWLDARHPNDDTQVVMILRHLITHRSITESQAMELYGVKRLSARISDIRVYLADTRSSAIVTDRYELQGEVGNVITNLDDPT